MEHLILRCKHCQKEYTYCTYGNGPEYGTEAGCSMEYCAECQTAIDKAFANIKVKFEPRYIEIKPTFGLDKLLEGIKGEQQPTDSSIFNFNVYCNGDNGYDNVEEYTHNGKRFHVEYNDDGEKHYFIQVEYDIEKQKYNTEKPWRTDDNSDTYTFYRSLRRHTEKMTAALANLKPRNLEPPLGQLFFNDIMWDVETLKTKETSIEPHNPHVKDTWHYKMKGTEIRMRLIHGQGDSRVRLGKGIKEIDILGIMDYDVTFERYQDENIITITSIVAC